MAAAVLFSERNERTLATNGVLEISLVGCEWDEAGGCGLSFSPLTRRRRSEQSFAREKVSEHGGSDSTRASKQDANTKAKQFTPNGSQNQASLAPQAVVGKQEGQLGHLTRQSAVEGTRGSQT
jgi:hypothetical protein